MACAKLKIGFYGGHVCCVEVLEPTASTSVTCEASRQHTSIPSGHVITCAASHFFRFFSDYGGPRKDSHAEMPLT